MRPSARLQAVIEILDALGSTEQPVDRFLRDWFRARRYAGSKDRAAVAELVFTIQRRRSSLAWRMGGDAPRRLAIAAMLLEKDTAAELDILFDGSQYGPAVLSDDERSAIASPPRADAPLFVLGEFPPFLEAELRRAFPSHPVIPGEAASAARPGTHSEASAALEVGPGSRSAEDALLGRDDSYLLAEMQALQSRAPIDLRVNTLKTTRDKLAEALHTEGFVAEPTPYSPVGLRLPPGEGLSKLSATSLYEGGAFEFQDEGSQIAALLCGAKPGMRVLDMAAGGGGKTLALAAVMQNQGEIVAYDVDRMRLVPLEPRAARAGVTIIATGPPGGEFDVVLVDSPCSGTGTWRRQPELRWRLTPDRLAELNALQDDLLAKAAFSVAPGGRLVYVTCSLLPVENEDRIFHFRADRPDFAVVPAAEVWRQAVGTAPPPGMDEFFRAGPLKTGTDGFFTAILQRAR